MSNLDFLEKEMRRRLAEAYAEARRDDLVRQALEAHEVSEGPAFIHIPLRVRLGTVLIRLGTRLAA